MPELPEVETVRRGILPAIGFQVASVWGSGLPLHGNHDVDLARIKVATKDTAVTTVERRGKYLLIGFSRRKKPTQDQLVIHLGMSGRLRLVDSDLPQVPHTHIVIDLKKGRHSYQLRYSDPRRFGQVFVYTAGREHEHPGLANLGVDPIVDGISGTTMHDCCQQTARTIKAALLDQEIIAGVGNIYACEALWMSQIHPKTPANKLSHSRCDRLAKAIDKALRYALEHGGTSLKDFVNADGHTGDHGDYLRVYGRDQKSCPRAKCPGTIRRTILHGRSTFHCPRCQKR